MKSKLMVNGHLNGVNVFVRIGVGIFLAIFTLFADYWGSVNILGNSDIISYVSAYSIWPADSNWRLIGYSLLACVSLIPATAVVCIPIGFLLGNKDRLCGVISGVLAATIWLTAYGWSNILTGNLIFISEIFALIVLSTVFFALGKSMANGGKGNRGQKGSRGHV